MLSFIYLFIIQVLTENLCSGMILFQYTLVTFVLENSSRNVKINHLNVERDFSEKKFLIFKQMTFCEMNVI